MGMTMLLTLLLVFVPCFPPDNFTNQADLFCVYEDCKTRSNNGPVNRLRSAVVAE